MLSLAVAVVSLTLASAVVPLALALLAFASASAFLRAAHAWRWRSATFLPNATRFGSLAGCVFGGSAVRRAVVGEFGGVGAGVGSSGIVSSGCEAIGYI